MSNETEIEEKSNEFNDTINPLFEKDLEQAHSNIKLDNEDKLSNHSITADSVETNVTVAVDEMPSVVPEIKFTAHPISMRVETSNVKMVDLMSFLYNVESTPIAPDGYIPNSEIRGIMRKPFVDYYPTKMLRKRTIEDDSKDLLEEILSKYLPAELMAIRQMEMKSLRDMALLAESRTVRAKTEVIMDDLNDELNKDLIEVIDSEEDDGKMDVTKRIGKSKRKKFARQITKAALMNQIERKVKENEERRRNRLLEDQSGEEEVVEPKELIDIDIMDILDQRLNDDTIKASMIDKEQRELDALMGTEIIDGFFKTLFDVFGEEETFTLIGSAIKHDEVAKENIDELVKGRQNRLLVLNAVTLPPYAFAYIAFHLGGDDKLINTALMMDDSKYGDQVKLEGLQSEISGILGNETKMVKYLAQLNWTLNLVNDKLKPFTDKSVPDIISGAFRDVVEDLAALDEIMGGAANRIKFLNLIKLGKDKEIEEFYIPEKIKPIEVIPEVPIVKESEMDIFGDLTDSQKNLLPSVANQDYELDFFSTIAKVLQSKVIKEKNMEEESVSSTNTILEEREFNFQDFRRRTQSIHEETVDDASKAVKLTGSGALKRSPSFYKDIYKSELGPTFSKERDVKDVSRRESKLDFKPVQVVGLKLSLKKSSDNVSQIQLLGETDNKATDLLRNYYDRLITKPWWPKDLMIEISSDSILNALVKILYRIAKATNHLDCSNCIIEFRKFFPPNRNTKKDVVQKLYTYLKEDSKGAEMAMKHNNPESHQFYCKRVLNNFNILKAFDEEINVLQEEFLRAYGDISKKRSSRSESKSEDIDRKRKDSYFDPQTLIKKIKATTLTDVAYVPEDKIKTLLVSMTTTTDLAEKLMISAALEELRANQDFSAEVRKETVAQMAVYFGELKDELMHKIRTGATREEQQKIYNQLSKSSDMLQSLVSQLDDSLKDSLPMRMPFLDDLRRTPDLIKTLGEPFISTELQKLKDSREIEYTEEMARRERHSILSKDFGPLKTDKIMFRRSSFVVRSDRVSDEAGSLRFQPDESGVTGTQKGIKGALPTIHGTRLHELSTKHKERKALRKEAKDAKVEGKEGEEVVEGEERVAREDSIQSLDDIDISDLSFDVRESMPSMISTDEQENADGELISTESRSLAMRGRRMSTKGRRMPHKGHRMSVKTDSKEEVKDSVGPVMPLDGPTYRETTSIRRFGKPDDETASYDSLGNERPRDMSTREIMKQQILDTKAISGEVIPLKNLMAHVKETIGLKMSPSNQVILENLITSLEAANIIENVTPRDQLIISKMLTELFVASASDQDQIGSVSKEMIHHFIEKIPLTAKTKGFVEETFVDNLEKLVTDLEEKKYAGRDMRNDLLTRIKDITVVVKGLAEQDEGIGKRMDKIMKISRSDEAIKSPITPSREQRKPSLQTHKLLNDTEILPILRTLSKDEQEIQILKLKMLSHLKDHNITTTADLTYPDEIITDLIKQRRASVKDTDKIIRISKALFAVTQEALYDNKELMEVVASEAFTNLIIDMQNILSESLQQFEIPVALTRATTNLLLLQNLGVFGLEDFEAELQKFKIKFPDEVCVSRNPLILDQLSKNKHVLNLSKNELIIDNKLNFLRNIDKLKPVGTEKAVEMGLILDADEEEYLAMQSLFMADESLGEVSLPAMFEMEERKRANMIETYKMKSELKDNMFEIENLVKQDKMSHSTLRTKQDGLDSIIAMARDEVPGSKSKLMDVISRNPALIALTNIGTVVELDLSKAKPRIKKESIIKLPSISSLMRSDSSSSSSIARQTPGQSKILPPIKPKHVTISMEPPSIFAKKVSKATTDDVVTNAPDTYASMGNLRARIKQEICKEYPFLADKINFDGVMGEVTEAQIIPEHIVKHVKRFHRIYGKDTTLLPFIGKSKSVIGDLLDQGLRAMHFNMGPGTLVRAIMEKEGPPASRKSTSSLDDEFKDIESLMEELERNRNSEPVKYMTSVQLRHCRMTSRPGSIPIHEWAKVAVSGTRHNLKHDLFGTLNRTHHCPHHMLAQKHLHRHGISIAKHIERYEMIEIINKSIQENAYRRIQDTLLKCFLRVLDDS